MCYTADSPSPREQLAQKIRNRTNDGDDILDYLFGVFYDKEPGVLHGHRIQAGRVLVIYGQLSPEAIKRLQELESHSDSKADRDQQKADSNLARKIRRMTGDGDDIITYLLDTMNGIDNASGKRVRHNNRLAAARELLKRGYPCECARHDAAQIETAATPEARPEPTTENDELITDNSELKIDEDPLDLVAMAKEIVASLDPADFEEEPPSNHKPDYSMWDIIESQPQPVITEEHARIGAALFREEMQKQRLWEESNVKIPTRKDHPNYDDG